MTYAKVIKCYLKAKYMKLHLYSQCCNTLQTVKTCRSRIIVACQIQAIFSETSMRCSEPSTPIYLSYLPDQDRCALPLHAFVCCHPTSTISSAVPPILIYNRYCTYICIYIWKKHFSKSHKKVVKPKGFTWTQFQNMFSHSAANL